MYGMSKNVGLGGFLAIVFISDAPFPLVCVSACVRSQPSWYFAFWAVLGDIVKHTNTHTHTAIEHKRKDRGKKVIKFSFMRYLFPEFFFHFGSILSYFSSFLFLLARCV